MILILHRHGRKDGWMITIEWKERRGAEWGHRQSLSLCAEENVHSRWFYSWKKGDGGSQNRSKLWRREEVYEKPKERTEREWLSFQMEAHISQEQSLNGKPLSSLLLNTLAEIHNFWSPWRPEHTQSVQGCGGMKSKNWQNRTEQELEDVEGSWVDVLSIFPLLSWHLLFLFLIPPSVFLWSWFFHTPRRPSITANYPIL